MKTGMKAPYKSGVIIPDIHYPEHDKKCIEIIKKVCKDLQPNYLVFLGDIINADGISRFTEKTIELGVYETAKELDGFQREIYYPLIKSCGSPEVYICGGNHDEQRIREAIQKMPERSQVLDMNKNFPEAKICKYNESHKIGKLYFTHGIYHNDAHAKKHVQAFGANVVYGHVHSIQSYTMVTRASGTSHKATSLGCVCNLNPDYMKNRPNAWQHAFGVCYWDKDGNYNLYPVEIVKGKAFFNGKLYK